MRTRDRDRAQERRTPSGGSPAGSDDNNPGGEDVRRRARRLLDFGDEAISQALSQNSEHFLRQNRQQGGQ